MESLPHALTAAVETFHQYSFYGGLAILAAIAVRLIVGGAR